MCDSLIKSLCFNFNDYNNCDYYNPIILNPLFSRFLYKIIVIIKF